MSVFHSRDVRAPWLGLLIVAIAISVTLFFSHGCQTGQTGLVIEKCVDQDGVMLPRSAVVTVYVGENENVMAKKWVYGEPLSFALPGITRTSKVKIRVSIDTPDILFLPMEPVTIEKKQTRRLVLQFFRPYQLSFTVTDRSGKPLGDVQLGYGTSQVTTDFRGQAAMALSDSRLRGGTVLDLQVIKPGYTLAAPEAGRITLVKGKFAYEHAISMTAGLPARSFSVDAQVSDTQGKPLENVQIYLGEQYLGATSHAGTLPQISLALAADESRSLRVIKEEYALQQIDPPALIRYTDTRDSYHFRIRLKKLVTARTFDLIVDAVDQSTGRGLAEVAIYLGDRRIGSTNRNGRLTLDQMSLEPGRSATLRAEKTSYKQLRGEPVTRLDYNDSETSYLITFYLQPQATPPPPQPPVSANRLVDITVSVKDSLTQAGLGGVHILVDGVDVGETDPAGNFIKRGYLLKPGDVSRLTLSKSGYLDANKTPAILRHADPQSSYAFNQLMTAEQSLRSNCERMTMLAEAAVKRSENNKAIDYYNQINLPTTPAEKRCYVSALNELGELYLKMREYESAVKSFQKGLAIDPQEWALRLNLAQTYYQSGNYDLAKTQLIEVEKLKFIIPAEDGMRQEVLINVKYIRALSEYKRFQAETNPDRREILRVSAYGLFEDLGYQLPENDEKYKYIRVDAMEKVNQLKVQ